MFVHAELSVDAGFKAAAARLASLAHDGWLTQASADVYDSGMTGLARVGPRGDVRLPRQDDEGQGARHDPREQGSLLRF